MPVLGRCGRGGGDWIGPLLGLGTCDKWKKSKTREHFSPPTGWLNLSISVSIVHLSMEPKTSPSPVEYYRTTLHQKTKTPPRLWKISAPLGNISRQTTTKPAQLPSGARSTSGPRQACPLPLATNLLPSFFTHTASTTVPSPHQRTN